MVKVYVILAFHQSVNQLVFGVRVDCSPADVPVQPLANDYLRDQVLGGKKCDCFSVSPARLRHELHEGRASFKFSQLMNELADQVEVQVLLADCVVEIQNANAKEKDNEMVKRELFTNIARDDFTLFWIVCEQLDAVLRVACLYYTVPHSVACLAVQVLRTEVEIFQKHEARIKRQFF